MSPKLKCNKHNSAHFRRQQGSMLVMAIFVLTVLSLLGLAITQILSDSSRSIVYEVYGARAFNAANSGAERALGELFPPGGTGNCTSVTTSFSLAPQTAFHGCAIEVTCNEFNVSETGYTHYRIDSTATCDGGQFDTVRAVAVEARQR